MIPGRVGFACKYMHHDQSLKKKELEEIQRPFNTRGTTIQWLDRQTRDVAEQRMWDIMVHNVASYQKLIEYVASLEPSQRMVRLGSDLLPAYTYVTYKDFWQQSSVVNYLERELSKVGEYARANDVRLSMHPGQFVVLASDNPDIVNNSIEEFEYHVDILRYMGYGQQFQDFKCNVHIAGRQGPAGITNVYSRLSPEARNTITIENDENSWGIDASLQLPSYIPLVLDIHHHWVKTGEYIRPSDDRFSRIIDSWRDVRPVIHYSVSREDYLTEHGSNTFPDKELLLEQGYKKAKLRAHSDFMWNHEVNKWASSFRVYADIMVESKMKNLASIPFEKNYRIV
jgi:UV DNA damage repair endonuclease